MSAARLRIATRGSALARWQADHVASMLGSDAELVIVETSGDQRQDVPVWEIGGRGVFVKEVQAAVLDGRADIAVHSAKDLPSEEVPGLCIGAVPERGDPRDAIVGCRLDDLAPGALVGTGSVRRRAQLAYLRPDLTFASLRGNIDTRLRKLDQFDAIVIANAALARLGRDDVVVDPLHPSLMLPQVGQGALAVECREDDERTRCRLSAIEHPGSRLSVDAERSFLARLGGGCDLPVGAYATVVGDGVRVEGLLATLDGRVVLRRAATGADAAEVGAAVADHLLDRAGGRALLEHQ